jgi:LysR family nitrogen assimilation transcriptional regulator
MELKQLDYFLGVAESGSFSKAAIRLSVAQPILSRQIKLLESELGVELLYRNGRGVVVSEAGKVLETYARGVVGLVEKAQSEIGSLKAEPRGRVAIAMPPSIGWMLTGPLVVRCREAFPGILLHLAEGFSGHVAEWLSTGRVDIGVVYQAPRLSTLQT